MPFQIGYLNKEDESDPVFATESMARFAAQQLSTFDRKIPAVWELHEVEDQPYFQPKLKAVYVEDNGWFERSGND